MSTSLHAAYVPAFIGILGNLKGLLDIAAATGNEAELIGARLADDMLPLARQIQIAADAAKGAGARMTGSEAPVMADDETTFAELKARCDKTIAYLQTIDAAAFAQRRLPCAAQSPGPSHNSLRSLRSLRSDRCDESDHEAR